MSAAGVGTVLQAGGSIVQGLGAKANADAEATSLRLQAGQEARIAALNIEDFLVNQSAKAANSRAGRGGSGRAFDDVDETIHANFESEVELERLKMATSISNRVRGLQVQADNTKKAGNVALFGSFLNAGSQLIAGRAGLPGGKSLGPAKSSNMTSSGIRLPARGVSIPGQGRKSLPTLKFTKKGGAFFPQ